MRVLVATDIAARGIDIDQLPQVVNFELPNVPEDYVHRIGRTGRAGSTGSALSLVDDEEMSYLRDIEKLIKRSIVRVEIEPGFVPPAKADLMSDERPPRPPQGRGGPRQGQNAGQRGATQCLGPCVAGKRCGSRCQARFQSHSESARPPAQTASAGGLVLVQAGFARTLNPLPWQRAIRCHGHPFPAMKCPSVEGLVADMYQQSARRDARDVTIDWNRSTPALFARALPNRLPKP